MRFVDEVRLGQRSSPSGSYQIPLGPPAGSSGPTLGSLCMGVGMSHNHQVASETFRTRYFEDVPLAILTQDGSHSSSEETSSRGKVFPIVAPRNLPHRTGTPPTTNRHYSGRASLKISRGSSSFRVGDGSGINSPFHSDGQTRQPGVGKSGKARQQVGRVS
jgi:hypothetical protein